ncbi:ATP-binding protein [Sphingomonas sp. DT-207]|uniref:ATP-binding protein n=1 Tax=Sphingomonas sp. DT-207 TaxID=3396167 RepID=UPI003F19603F
MFEGGWLSDNAGRIENISLAPNVKNAIYPLFEAVMNSIHAIEERFGPDGLARGRINITLHGDQRAEYTGFTVADNGVGFTSDNLTSLRKFDSRKKAKLGGKGVGRLLWLKVSDEAAIRSSFIGLDDKVRTCTFRFTVTDPVADYTEIASGREEIGTSITINPFKSVFASRLPKKADTFANRLIAHFVSYFTNISHPEIVIVDETDPQADAIDLFDIFSEKVERDSDFTFSVDSIPETFTIHCFLLPKSISDDERSVNALYLGANGRAVTRHELDSVLGMKAIDSKYAFLGYVESQFLDSNANDMRTAFSLDEEQIATIVDAAKQRAKEFLDPEIKEIRQKQADRIVAIGREHPRFFYAARHANDVAESLHLSNQSEEEIFVELSRSSLRDYKRRKRGYSEAYKNELPDVEQQTEEFMQKLKEDAMSSLAEYVARRKSILEIFEAGLRYKDIEDETSHYEKIVHGIICPLNSTSQELGYEDHNLWLIDDRLAFYTYFNSDRKMKSQVTADASAKDRPDITLFDLGLGFNSDDHSQPITIVEFKRPKRDDYTLTDNPISQVRSYVQQLRDSGEAIKFDGSPLRNISEDTPFTCYIVADITKSLRQVMRDLGQFSQRAGSASYYWWDSNYKTFIEIASFSEVLSSAKARNQAFFKHLGID